VGGNTETLTTSGASAVFARSALAIPVKNEALQVKISASPHYIDVIARKFLYVVIE